MPIDNTNIGSVAEAACAAALRKAGKKVLIPLLDGGARYDLVLDEFGVFKRVQCKTGLLRNGVVSFNTRGSKFKLRSNDRIICEPSYYTGQIEYICAYCFENDKTYLVPFDGLPKAKCHLRVEPTKSGVVKGIRWAAQYEVKPLIPTRRGPHKSKLDSNLCKTCKKPVSGRYTLFCEECIRNATLNPNKPSKEQLESDISTMPWTHIGAKYGVTDNAAKKWAIGYGIAILPRHVFKRKPNSIGSNSTQ